MSALSFMLAFTLVAAAAFKVADRRRFEDVVAGWQLGWAWLPRMASVGLPLAELVVAVALLVAPGSVGGTLAAVLIGGFLAGSVWVAQRAGAVNCGCLLVSDGAQFGVWEVARSAGLLVIALSVAVAGQPSVWTAASVTAGLALTVALLSVEASVGLWARTRWEGR